MPIFLKPLNIQLNLKNCQALSLKIKQLMDSEHQQVNIEVKSNLFIMKTKMNLWLKFRLKNKNKEFIMSEQGLNKLLFKT